MLSIAKRVIAQISGDKRTVALIVIAPLLIMTLLSLLLGDTDYIPSIAINEKKLPYALVSALKLEEAVIVHIPDSVTDTEQYLKDNKDIDAVLIISPSGPVITMYEASNKSALAMKAIQNAVTVLNPMMHIQTNFIIGNKDESFFKSMGHVFLGIIAFFLIFIVAGIALVRERSGGTLERMMMTGVKRSSVIGGYTIGYSLFAAIQAVVLVFFSVYVLGIHNEGSILWVVLIMILIAVAAVSFGELISIFANNEFQVMQFIPIVIIPQIFFSGIIPVDTIPYKLGNLCYIMPIYYGCQAIRELMFLGHGFREIWQYVAALLVFIAVLSMLNTIALKKYRKL